MKRSLDIDDKVALIPITGGLRPFKTMNHSFHPSHVHETCCEESDIDTKYRKENNGEKYGINERDYLHPSKDDNSLQQET